MYYLFKNVKAIYFCFCEISINLIINFKKLKSWIKISSIKAANNIKKIIILNSWLDKGERDGLCGTTFICKPHV